MGTHNVIQSIYKRPMIRVALVCMATSLLYNNCGSTITPTTNSDMSSREDVETSSGKLAVCNKFISGDITGITSIYTDNLRGHVPDWIRLRLKMTTNPLVANTNWYIKFFRYSEVASYSRSLNSSSVQMTIIVNGQTQPLNLNSPINSISRNTINSFISTYNLGTGSNAITLSNFFSRVTFVLTGMDMTYDSVMMVIYENDGDGVASNDAIVRSAESLIPAFSADPNVYAAGHPSTSLIATHPLYSLRNSGRSEDQFQIETNLYCQEYTSN